LKFSKSPKHLSLSPCYFFKVKVLLAEFITVGQKALKRAKKDLRRCKQTAIIRLNYVPIGANKLSRD